MRYAALGRPPRAQQKAETGICRTCPGETIAGGCGNPGMTWVGVDITAAINCSRGQVPRLGVCLMAL